MASQHFAVRILCVSGAMLFKILQVAESDFEDAAHECLNSFKAKNVPPGYVSLPTFICTVAFKEVINLLRNRPMLCWLDERFLRRRYKDSANTPDTV